MQVLGIFFPFFWLVAILLPLCLPGTSIRRVALASGIALLTYLIIAIILAPTLAVTRSRGGNHMSSSMNYNGMYNQG